jgi:dimethylargininase
VDLALARKQHVEYCGVLESLGLEIIELPPIDTHPDCCFVEDTAVIVGDKAVVSRLAREERRGEEESVSLILKDYLEISSIREPGMLEGGDVIHCEEFLIAGESSRTNISGIDQMSKWLGIPVKRVTDPELIHLKSHVTYIGENTIVVTPRYVNHEAFEPFTPIVIPLAESYAANTLTVNGSVLMSASHPLSTKAVREAGFEVIELNMSEFEKCEGALTCLSLIF